MIVNITLHPSTTKSWNNYSLKQGTLNAYVTWAILRLDNYYSYDNTFGWYQNHLPTMTALHVWNSRSTSTTKQYYLWHGVFEVQDTCSTKMRAVLIACFHGTCIQEMGSAHVELFQAFINESKYFLVTGCWKILSEPNFVFIS